MTSTGGFSAIFIRRPVGTTLLTLGLALAGLAAFFQLPVAPLPQVDFPTIVVSAQMPGASPETMATSVATPLERHLGVIADVTEMTSSSTVGSTRITLQFALSRDIDGAARDVQAAINAARADLPASLQKQSDLSQGQPGRRADHDPVADLRHADARPDLRRRVDGAGAGAVADRRRRTGHDRRRRGARRAGRARPGAAVPVRHRPRGRPRRDRGGQRPQPERRDRGRHAALAALRQRPGRRRRTITSRS